MKDAAADKEIAGKLELLKGEQQGSIEEELGDEWHCLCRRAHGVWHAL